MVPTACKNNPLVLYTMFGSKPPPKPAERMSINDFSSLQDGSKTAMAIMQDREPEEPNYFNPKLNMSPRTPYEIERWELDRRYGNHPSYRAQLQTLNKKYGKSGGRRLSRRSRTKKTGRNSRKSKKGGRKTRRIRKPGSARLR